MLTCNQKPLKLYKTSDNFQLVTEGVGNKSCVASKHELPAEDCLCLAEGFKLIYIKQFCFWPCFILYAFVIEGELQKLWKEKKLKESGC